jgi:hypothetical protein
MQNGDGGPTTRRSTPHHKQRARHNHPPGMIPGRRSRAAHGRGCRRPSPSKIDQPRAGFRVTTFGHPQLGADHAQVEAQGYSYSTGVTRTATATLIQ